MTDMVKLEAEIRVKLDTFQAEGGKLIRGDFRHGDNCRCLVDACFPSSVTSGELTDRRASALSSVVRASISEDQMWSMVFAWDNPREPADQTYKSQEDPFYQLGYRLQRDYKPTSAHSPLSLSSESESPPTP